MITVDLYLNWGTIKSGRFIPFDGVHFEFNHESGSDYTLDNINDWLNIHTPLTCNYAELYVKIPEFNQRHLIGTFKTLKLKSGKTRWIVSD